MKRFLMMCASVFAVLTLSACGVSPQKYMDGVLAAWNDSMEHNNAIIKTFDEANTGEEFAALKDQITKAREMNQKHLDEQRKILDNKKFPDDAADLQANLVKYLEAAVVELDAFMVLANEAPADDDEFISKYNEIIDNQTKASEDLMDIVDKMIDDYAAKHKIKLTVSK